MEVLYSEGVAIHTGPEPCAVAREGGGDIKICGATPKVLQVFEILGFPALFDLLPDVAATVKRYAEVPIKGGE